MDLKAFYHTIDDCIVRNISEVENEYRSSYCTLRSVSFSNWCVVERVGLIKINSMI